MVIFTANLQHGQGTDGNFDFSRQITALSSADLIGVQERASPETGWDAPMASAGLVQAIYRPNQVGGGDGCAIWYKSSTVTILDSYEHQLSNGAVSPWDGIPTNVDKSAVAVKALFSGRQFYFVATHLAQAAGADSNGSLFSSIRVAQINELLSWIDSTLTGLDVVLVGDMNLGPDYLKSPSGFQLDLFTANYFDLWTRGINDGKATANWTDRNSDGTADMPITSLTTRTHDTRRIDYCFLRKNPDVLSFTSIDLPDSRANCSGALTGNPAFCPDTASDQRWGTPDDFGVRPSDHNWVKFTLGFQGARKKRIAITV
jgi:endonuclease/exonuclease/phosphatase family metal-dependent hydrolase